uniref:Uncharacterized protein n=1 Tax=Anopheles albimanus TaxID=7167 RepID=A0A182FXQ8_ANOAL
MQDLLVAAEGGRVCGSSVKCVPRVRGAVCEGGGVRSSGVRCPRCPVRRTERNVTHVQRRTVLELVLWSARVKA